ncbi:MAG: hypothetical protein A2W22_01530 [Candidatus Levybacteria bacterium RBG_16_35_11]|nr:MAG: hypothetical protein A2W22_01530 [Candidatus Levybacteria bacterium RBG_16_35_11]
MDHIVPFDFTQGKHSPELRFLILYNSLRGGENVNGVFIKSHGLGFTGWVGAILTSSGGGFIYLLSLADKNKKRK